MLRQRSEQSGVVDEVIVGRFDEVTGVLAEVAPLPPQAIDS